MRVESIRASYILLYDGMPRAGWDDDDDDYCC